MDAVDLLLLEHPFTIGDQVMIGGLEGIVENIRVRDTQILTYAGERIFIPNKMVFANPIINFTQTPSLRSEARLGIKDAQQISAAKNAALSAIRSVSFVIEQPEPQVTFEWEKDHIVLVIKFWIESDRALTEKAKSAVLQAVLDEFDKCGISYIPERS